MDIRWDDQLDHVTAPLNYLDRTGERPFAYAYDAPPGKRQRSGNLIAWQTKIRSARPVVDQLSVDRQGFDLVAFQPDFADFLDGGKVKSLYYPQAERVLKEATGAAEVIAFDHNVRSGMKPSSDNGAVKEPVKRVHNDFTVNSGPRRARDELAARGLDAGRLAARFAIVNLWRPIRGPLEDSPLAVCDAATIDPDDLIASDLIYRDRVGETYAVAHGPRHRWYYFPKMTTAEALLIKVYDSAGDGIARFSAHSAFDDPMASPDALPRASIELRALVLF